MKLNSLEKRTFIYLMLASFCHGFVMSSFQVQDIIAKKALGALDWQITVLVMLWPLSNLFSIWWGKILEHSSSIAKYFILTGLVGRLVLILMLWVTNYYQYLAILILVFSFNAFISPAQNSILQNNVTKQNRGNMFGYSASIVTLVAVFSSYFAGKMLDVNETYFRYFFSVVGVFGFLHSIFMSRIKIKKNHNKDKAFISIKEVIVKPIQRSLEVLKKNHDFAIFQRNYFIYGIAFMILLPAIPKYLVDYLRMNYSQTFLAKGILSQIGILFLAPLAGRFFDKRNPALFTSFTYLILSLYPLFLLISSFFIGTSFVNLIVYTAFFFFSIAMSGIVISWNISSIFFAQDEDVSMYQSVHVTLTGLRGIFAPFLGLMIMEVVGVRAVFGLAFFLFLLASCLNFRLYYHMHEKEWKMSSKAVWGYFRKLFPYN
ncbi:MAG: MFS transporter [Candidatus Cloacimonetes bacterium]|nr:MFS transporter [Candidatus Cloacimonadota bacterium]MCF7813224.1 MFS transporter [Candidatus Cloacimonadota bacterium]MCF7867423.1 MFS transporter [Candidatus Cloacimonadota bacterium]MCF7882945.1 MFS transporter [Candidatus Cloacimonadota bacterium]